jgi:hypothetical protein
MKEFERVSEQPMKSQWQAEKQSTDNKPEQKHSRRPSLLQFLDRRQSRSSNTIPPDNNVPNVPEQPSPELTQNDTKPTPVDDVRTKDQELEPSAAPTDTPQESAQQEKTQGENNTDIASSEPKESAASVAEKPDSDDPPVSLPQTTDSTGSKEEDIQKQESLPQGETNDSATSPEETKEATST